MINKFIDYREKVENRQTNLAPKRILFYRDGVSEGQFQQVLRDELPLIQGLFGTFPTDTFFCSSGIHQRLVKKRKSPQKSPLLSLESDTTPDFSRWCPTPQRGAGIARPELSWTPTSFIPLSLISTCKATEVLLEHLARRITVCYTTRMDSRESKLYCAPSLC